MQPYNDPLNNKNNLIESQNPEYQTEQGIQALQQPQPQTLQQPQLQDQPQPKKLENPDRSKLFLPIRKAQEIGASTSQILQAISVNYPEFNPQIQKALGMGATEEQIFEALSERPGITEDPVRKVGRIATQGAIGLAEKATWKYNLAVIGAKLLFSGDESGKNMFEQSKKHLLKKKELGLLDEEGEKKLNRTEKLLKFGESLPEFPSIDVGSLIEKGFEYAGIDMKPEDFAEHTARFIGLMGKPKEIFKTAEEVYKNPRQAADLAKAVTPTVNEIARSMGATAGLQIAQDGGFGVMASMTTMMLSELLAGGLAGVTKKGLKAATHPIETAKKVKASTAKAVAIATKSSRKEVADSVATNMKATGLEADIGTLTGSRFVQLLQSFLEHSGLVGDSLEALRARVGDGISKKYEEISDSLGDYKYRTVYDAGMEAIALSKALNIQMPSKEKLVPVPGMNRSLKGRIATKPLPEYENNFLNTISPYKFNYSREAGQELKTVANNIREPKKKYLNKEFNKLEEEVEGLHGTFEDLEAELIKFIDKNSGSFIGEHVTSESKVLETVKTLLEEIRTKNVRYQQSPSDIKEYGKYSQSIIDAINKTLEKETNQKPLSGLIKSKRSFMELADYDFGGSKFEGKFKFIVELIDDEIMKALKVKNKKLSKKYKKLNGEYSEYKKTFQNKKVIKLFEKNNENYVSIYESFLNQDSMSALSKILGENEYSKLTLNKMKRDYAREFIERGNYSERKLNDLESVIGKSDSVKKLIREREENLRGLTPAKVATSVPENLRPSTIKQNKGINFKAKISEQQKINNLRNKIGNKTPEQIFNMMDSVSGIKELKALTDGIEGGKELMNNFKRLKLDKMIGENMIDSVTQELKLGTFSKILEKGNNREIVKELLGKKAYKDLVYIQKHSASLAKSGQKFYNTSRTATTERDFKALLGLVVSTVTAVTTGNPWLPLEAGSLLYTGSKVSKLIADEEFLSMVRDAIIAEQKNNKGLLKRSWTGLLKKAKESMGEVEKASKSAALSL